MHAFCKILIKRASRDVNVKNKERIKQKHNSGTTVGGKNPEDYSMPFHNIYVYTINVMNMYLLYVRLNPFLLLYYF